jgi:hypothetical protein
MLMMAKAEDEAIDKPRREAAEQQILDLQREVDFDVREYPVEVIVQKFNPTEEAKGISELYVPDYQRDFAWDERRQSRFIESVLIGLPIPYLFVADVMDEDEAKSGRLEIVDGSQRVRTLNAFLNDRLVLSELEKLPRLAGFRFSDLPLSRQRRFKRTTLRMIELTEKADEEVRRDIFERINTGSVELEEMEKRRGIRQGPMLTLIEECARNPLYHELVPMTEPQIKRREREELVLRFFAYLDNYQAFGAKNQNRVRVFLDEHLKLANADPGFDPAPKKAEFQEMLEYAKRSLPNGFSKGAKHRTTPRIRFEALSVGIALARRQFEDLKIPEDLGWLESDTFKELTTSDSSNSRPRVVNRIEFVRDALIENHNAV